MSFWRPERIGAEAVLLIAVLIAGVTGCSKMSAGRQQTGAGEGQADTISTFTLVGHTESGRKKWEIRGQSADLLAGTVHLSPVEATSYGEVKTDLTAREGRYNKLTQDVWLEKDVVVTTSEGTRLTTDSFHWVAQQEMGSTPDWVTVTRQGMRVVGLGGVGFPKLKRVRLERNVTVTLQGKEGETIVTCDGPMETDYGRRKARFWRNVLVRDAKGTIQSDRMDVALDPQTNQIQKATFWGHVKINHGPQVAYANRANYWQLQGRTSLSGHPRLVMRPEDEGF